MSVDAVYQTDIEAYIDSLPISDEEKAILLSGTTDGETLDAAILADPAFLAYWQATYVTLMMHIDPVTFQAGVADIGSDASISELYDYLQSHASAAENAAVQEYTLEHAGILGLAASTDDDSETSPQAILDAIEEYESSNASYNFVNEEAYEMVDELDLDNADLLNYAISFSDWTANIEMICQDQMLYFQSQFGSIAEAMSSGEISPEIAQAELGQVTATMQFWTGIQQNAMSQNNNIQLMFSQMLKADFDAKQQLNNNIKSVAA